MAKITVSDTTGGLDGVLISDLKAGNYVERNGRLYLIVEYNDNKWLIDILDGAVASWNAETWRGRLVTTVRVEFTR